MDNTPWRNAYKAPLSKLAVLLAVIIFTAGAIPRLGLAQPPSMSNAYQTVFLPVITTTPPARINLSLATSPYDVDPSDDPWFDVTLTVANTGQVGANNIMVNIYYDPTESALSYWPANTVAIGDGVVALLFDGTLAPGSTSTTQLVFQASAGNFNGQLLDYSASYTVANGGSGDSNTAAVRLLGTLPPPPGSFSCASAYPTPPLGVQPASGRGLAGTQFLFAAFQSVCGYTFAPGDTISLWANMPDGSAQPIDQVIADDQGDIEQGLDTTGYAAGCYGMVASNQDQSNQLVGPFILDSIDGPAQCGTQPSARSAGGEAAFSVARGMPAVAAPEALGGVRGRVTGARGVPVPDVLVAVRDPATGTFLKSALTGADGQYLIPAGLPTGSYEMLLTPSRSRANTTAVYADTSVPLHISAPTITTLSATLSRGAAISGRVTTAIGGVGLEGLPVLVYDVAGTRLVAVSITDIAGNYTTPALADGSYRVRFAPAKSPREATRGYVGAFYSDQASGASPKLVSVNASTPITGISARLERCAACGQISGRVRAQDTGAGLAGVDVVIRDADTQQMVALVKTDSAGQYDAILKTGRYSVSFIPAYASSTITRRYRGQSYGAQPVSVAAPEITSNVDVDLLSGAQVSGNVTAADSGVVLRNVTVVVQDAAGRVSATAITGADGSYTLPGLASGSYHILFRPAKGAKNLPYSATDRDVAVTAPSDIHDLDAALVGVGGPQP